MLEDGRRMNKVSRDLLENNYTLVNVFRAKALPIALTSLETKLLVEEGIAVIVSKATALLKTPTELDLHQYKDGLNDRLTEQAETLKHQKLKDTEINLDKIMSGKRKKLLQKGIPETGEIRFDCSCIKRNEVDIDLFPIIFRNRLKSPTNSQRNRR